jgi:hypothetical protein
VLLAGLICTAVAQGCQQHDHAPAPAMPATASQPSSTAGDRFELDVPPGTIVVLGATRRDATPATRAIAPPASIG